MSELNKIDIEKALESSDTSSGTFESQYSSDQSDVDEEDQQNLMMKESPDFDKSPILRAQQLPFFTEMDDEELDFGDPLL